MASVEVNFENNVCVICRDSLTEDNDISTVTRGLESLIDLSSRCNDADLHRYLVSQPTGVVVHNRCRRLYQHKAKRKNSGESVDESAKPKTLRSSTSFGWKQHCFFCSKPCMETKRTKTKVRHVEVLDVLEKVREMGVIRGDAFGLEVVGRLNSINCLVAEEAVYHVTCHRYFFRTSSASNRGRTGRPTESAKEINFQKLCNWMEVNDKELLTLEDVTNKAKELAPDNDTIYSEKWLKKKLIEKYREHIQFNEVRGRRNVICWKEMASFVINDKWHEDRKGMEHSEAEQSSSMEASFSSVTFCDIQELYTNDSTINVQFIVSEIFRPSSNDSIGLYKIGWISVQNYVGLVKVPVVDDNSAVEETPSTVMSVTFNVKDLTVEDGEFYQFCYLSGNNQIRGVSIPFQFVMDDFEIFPDMPCTENPAESFVHAEQPESVLSLSLVKSAFSDSDEVSSLRQRIAELEEVSTRVSTESLNYRQENEKLLQQLQTLEENFGKENTQLLQNIESLKKEVNEKNQLLGELTGLNKDLVSQLAEERQKISVLDISFKALRDAQKQLEGRCTKLTKEKCSLEIDRMRLIKENERLSLSVAELTSKVELQLQSSSSVTAAQNEATTERLCSTMDVGKDLPSDTSQDARWFDQQLIETANNFGVDVPPTASAPNLVDVMDQGIVVSVSQSGTVTGAVYGFVDSSISSVPTYQAPIHPYPYAIPRTWYPNPYADYIPEIYRTGHLPQY